MDIREEVLSRDDCAVAYAAKDCHELARLLSIGRTKVVLVQIADIQAAMMRTGIWWTVKPLLTQPDHPAYMAAVVVSDVSQARYSNLDLSLPLVTQMFSALVTAGVMPQAFMDSLTNMGIVPDVLTQREVAIALYNDNDGSAK